MALGPAELVQLSHVSRRFYLEGASQVQIAAELGISRFKVARLIDKAVREGIVKIEIASPGSVDIDLSVRLQAAFGLTRALAVTTPNETPEVIQNALGQVAAQLLEEIATEDSVLGFTAGRTLTAFSLNVHTLPYCEVVALGGVAGPVKDHGIEVVRRVGKATSGPVYPIFAPLFVSNAEAAASLRSDRSISLAFARFDRITLGMVAIGSWAPPDSQLYDAAEQAGIADTLLAHGVVGEIGATTFDAEGEIVHLIDDRSVAISAEQLRRVPEVIAVAGGPSKTSAIRAALKTGLVNSLITDAAVARRLLKE